MRVDFLPTRGAMPRLKHLTRIMSARVDGRITEAEERELIAELDRLAKLCPQIAASPSTLVASQNRKTYQDRGAARRGAIRQATPRWANISAIEALYAQARSRTKESGTQYVVDHVVPLQSPIVSGLHCESNLMVITAMENGRKHNREWPDAP